MHYYRIAEVTVAADRELRCYSDFVCEPGKADVTITGTDELPPPGKEIRSKMVSYRKLDDGWFLHPMETETTGMYINGDYTQVRTLGTDDPAIMGGTEWYIRIAMECILARRGYLSLHAAAVEVQGGAYAFSGPSGIGKSTRAVAWREAFGANLINGDRPLIDVRKMELYGVPWDGKEQCFRNVHYPLKAICEVRRSDSTYVRTMDFNQRRKLLLRQCFMPMWDTETAAMQMINISRLAAQAEMVRIFSGPSAEDARALLSALEQHQYLREEPDMKAKPGFILRNVVDEYILMPTGDNIGKFNGTVLLNEVSALVWEKLQNPVSRDDLLKAVQDEYEVEKAVASADLDALLDTFRKYGVIEDE